MEGEGRGGLPLSRSEKFLVEALGICDRIRSKG